MKKDSKIEGLFSFITIFDWKVWCLIVCMIIAMGILLFLIEKFSPFILTDWKTNFMQQMFGFPEFIWKIFGVFALGHLAGATEKQRQIASQIVIFGVYIFCFICIIFYQANLAVFLTISRLNSPITSIVDLIENNIKYSLVDSTSTQVFFEDMKRIEEDFFQYWIQTSLSEDYADPNKHEIFWEYPLNNVYTILSNNMKVDGYLNTTAEGIQRVLDAKSDEKFAFFTEYPTALYATKKYCNLEIVGKQFSTRPYSLGVTKNSWLKKELNEQILILQREGTINELKIKWWNYESSNCKEVTNTQINMQSIGGLFIFMGVCLVLLVVTMGFEFLICVKKEIKTSF